MRPIKFRAWDKAMKVMRPVWSIGWKAWDAPDDCINTVELERNGTVGLAEEEVVLMQFTGLHDRHGKEIYEGDILKFNGVVRYEEGTGGGPEEGARWVGFEMNELHPFHEDELLGNVYEHPQLLTPTP